MDYIEEMSKACEGIAAVGVPLAIIGAIGMLFHYKNKKNAEERATTQNAYYDTHEIPANDRTKYRKIVCDDATAYLKDIAPKFLNTPEGKAEVKKIKADIIKDVSEYIDDGDGPRFEPDKLSIKIGLFDHSGDNQYDLTEVEYSGKGFIPDDNLWELGCFASENLAKKLCAALQEKYAEEIKCRFVDIYNQPDYGTIVIE